MEENAEISVRKLRAIRQIINKLLSSLPDCVDGRNDDLATKAEKTIKEIDAIVKLHAKLRVK